MKHLKMWPDGSQVDILTKAIQFFGSLIVLSGSSVGLTKIT